MNWDLEARAGEALEALEQGEAVEAILGRYPEHAAALRPILEVARELQELPLAYAVSAQQSSREAMLREARRLHGRSTPSLTRFSGLRRLGFAFAALLVLIVAAAGLLAQPVSAALPGQALYPLKRAAENVQLRLAADPAAVQERLREERRGELLALLAAGQEAEVDCFGTIRSFTEESWQLDDYVLFLTPASTVAGLPALGAPVEGRCLVRDGQVFAQDMRITGPGKLPPEPPEPTPPTPAPTPTPTPTLTATPTPTATDTPSPAAPGGAISPVATPDDDDDDDNSTDEDSSGPGDGEPDDDSSPDDRDGDLDDTTGDDDQDDVDDPSDG